MLTDWLEVGPVIAPAMIDPAPTRLPEWKIPILQ
jgi:hypothetical protein